MVNSTVIITPNIVVAVEAPPKCGKTHFALTFPDPMVVFSFDIGIEPILKKFGGKDIIVVTYPIPIVETVRAIGFKKDISAIWNQFVEDFRKAVDDPRIKTVVIDTGTAMYEICRIGRSGELGRELDPTEYGDVYLRIKSLIQRCRITGKNLVLTHYLKDVYVGREPTGEKVLDGWRHTEGEVDVVLLLSRQVVSSAKGEKKNVIVTLIKDNRYDLDVNGQTFENATYDDLVAVLRLNE